MAAPFLEELRSAAAAGGGDGQALRASLTAVADEDKHYVPFFAAPGDAVACLTAVGHADVYIGPISFACNEDALRARQVASVLTVAAGRQPEPMLRSIRYLRYEVEDSVEADLLAVLPQLTQWIEWRRSHGAVLVHCRAGVSRSATVMTAYIMRKLQLGFADALKALQDSRRCCRPNAAFSEQLLAFESALSCGDVAYFDTTAPAGESEELRAAGIAAESVAQLLSPGEACDAAGEGAAGDEGRPAVVAPHFPALPSPAAPSAPCTMPPAAPALSAPAGEVISCDAKEEEEVDEYQLAAPRRKKRLFGFDWGGGYVSPWQPTPDDTLSSVLEAVQLSSCDVLCDVGAGDGRVLIAAAVACGCQGVGIELDGVLARKAEKAAAAAGVEELVTMMQVDFMTASLPQADVILLYLLPAALAKLEDRLLQLLHAPDGKLRAVITIAWPLPSCDELLAPIEGAEDLHVAHRSRNFFHYLPTKE